MIFVHENNFISKISTNYNGIGKIIEKFYLETYLDVKKQLLEFDFSKGDSDVFKEATGVINDYYKKLDKFAKDNKITSQSKFRSTFLEELSVYLFDDNEFIRSNSLGVYNNGIFAGIKIGNDLKVNIMRKDVDFCIGKKVKIQIDSKSYEIILPVIVVEVKTYLDATMFGEVQYSSRLLKNATPNVRTYVLMETNQVGIDKIVSARYDKILNEMFVLKKDKKSDIEYKVLLDYYNQICSDINDIAMKREIIVPGRLIELEKNLPN